MAEVVNLLDKDAIEKIKKFASGSVAMFGTFASNGEPMPDIRPMSTLQVDEDGTIWFFSPRDSHKNKHISANARVQLIYSLPDKSEFMTLSGKAAISRDPKKIDELWTPLAKAWFNEGKSDPNLTVIAVRPHEGHYWDTKYNRMIQVIQLAVGAVVGKPLDGGVEGSLRTK